MKDGCLTPEELALALGAPEDDAGRGHLEQCTWCQGLAASLDLFQRDGGLPAGADIDDAEDRLDDFLQREIVGEDGRPRPVPLARTPQKQTRRWSAPTVWAAAALLVVMVGLTTVLDRESGEAGHGILRGGEPGTALVLDAIQVEADGGMKLVWSRVEGAVGYVVVLLDANDHEIMRMDAGIDTSLTLVREDLELPGAGPSPWFVRIEARDEADVIERSRPRSLPPLFPRSATDRPR